MSQRERDRLKVLHAVQKGHWTQRQAAGQLGMTDRSVRKLLKRLRKEGDRGVKHVLRGEPARTQIGRALDELGIEWIEAHSPQAKGRVERCFGTLQDRLVKGLRLAGADTLEPANAYLRREFLPEWQARFRVQPANPTDAHRGLGREHDLAAILSVVEERAGTNDYTLRYHRELYQIDRADVRGGMRGAKVRVEKRLDGTLAVRFRDRYLTIRGCPSRAPAQAVRPRVKTEKTSEASTSEAPRRWMEGFSLKNNPPLWKVLKQESGRWESDREGR